MDIENEVKEAIVLQSRSITPPISLKQKVLGHIRPAVAKMSLLDRYRQYRYYQLKRTRQFVAHVGRRITGGYPHGQA